MVEDGGNFGFFRVDDDKATGNILLMVDDLGASFTFAVSAEEDTLNGVLVLTEVLVRST